MDSVLYSVLIKRYLNEAGRETIKAWASLPDDIIAKFERLELDGLNERDTALMEYAFMCGMHTGGYFAVMLEDERVWEMGKALKGE